MTIIRGVCANDLWNSMQIQPNRPSAAKPHGYHWIWIRLYIPAFMFKENAATELIRYDATTIFMVNGTCRNMAVFVIGG